MTFQSRVHTSMVHPAVDMSITFSVASFLHSVICYASPEEYAVVEEVLLMRKCCCCGAVVVGTSLHVNQNLFVQAAVVVGNVNVVGTSVFVRGAVYCIVLYLQQIKHN